MTTLNLLAEFIAKSDLKKVGVAVYFWTSLLVCKAKFPALMGEENLTQLLLLLILAVFFANVATHYIKNRYGAAKAPDSLEAKVSA